MGISNREEWCTLDDITLMDKEESKDKLYCISVDSPEKQFLIGEIGVPTHNTDEAKIADELKGESIMIIVSTCFSITTCRGKRKEQNSALTLLLTDGMKRYMSS